MNAESCVIPRLKRVIVTSISKQVSLFFWVLAFISVTWGE